MTNSMERVLIGDLKNHIGQSVAINGWVSVRRDQGKMVFFDIRDRSGTIQGVVLPKSEAITIAKETNVESAVAMTGIVNQRPEKNVVADKQNGDIELQIEGIEILNAAQTLPFELHAELNLDTHLDNLPLTLKSERTRQIFTLQATILDEYRNSLKSRGFTEFVAPAIVGGDAEGGAAVFKLEYFKEQSAYLATSPQFYKQIMTGAFERAFTIAKVFRAEKSATTRHISEITQMDFEMAFIKDETEVMKELQTTIQDVVKTVGEKHPEIFTAFKTEIPLAPAEFPVFTLQEAQAIVAKEYGREIEDTNDMAPEDERQICEYTKAKFGSDFVFITRFPTKKRAFYTYEEPSEAPLSRGFDLLFRGLEINSGAQRIHNYDSLIARIKERGMDPEKFEYYLQTFKYGIPPHGGCSTGLERFTGRMLELANIKESTAFPRDMTRIDGRLSE
jgi:nondiscriminating aspartyl-tRNA synthetase